MFDQVLLYDGCMTDEGIGEPREVVLTAARAVDPAFTEVMFKKWRDRGLVPRPIARPGRGREHGRGAVYPAGTTAQVLRVLAIRAEGGRFDPDRALWRLWWERAPVDPERIRVLLAAELDRLEGLFGDAFEGDELGENAVKAIMRLAGGNLDGLLRAVRRQIGHDGFAQVCALMVRVAAGRFDGWETTRDREWVDRALMLDRARRDRIGSASPWYRGNVEEVLRTVSRVVSLPALRTTLSGATDDELVLAREELRELLAVADAARTLAEALRGFGAFGFSALPSATELGDVPSPTLLLWWLSVRRLPEVPAGLETLRSVEPWVVMARQVAVDWAARKRTRDGGYRTGE